MSPLVTVVLPTYARAERLERAILSILDQTYPNIEIIVVNDNVPGSPDDIETSLLLAEFSATPNIRTIRTVGKVGGGAARNIGCKEANGQYLAFLDDDDLYHPKKIETQLDHMLLNSLELSFQDVEWRTDNGRLVETRVLDHVSDFSEEGLIRAHVVIPIAPTGIYMLKKEFFERTDGFGEVQTGQDWHLFLNCILAGARIGYMPGVFVTQFIHDGERLSLGQNKIEGETARHKIVQKYYHLLSPAEIKFAEFRHTATLSFASFRGKNYQKALLYGIRTLFTSPYLCFTEGRKYFNR